MVKFDNVTFRYIPENSNSGAKELDFEIKKGEFVVFCGLSGSGKSTVSRLINGLAPNFYEGNITGNISLNGSRINDMPLYEISKYTASVFQNPRSQFFTTDTNGELAFACENMGLPIEEIKRRVDESVKLFRIEDLLDRNLFELSGGEKQRIACAGSYAAYPEIFVLDEPSSNLDYGSIDALKNILKQIKAQNKTVIIVEHRLYYLAELADRFFYMKDGRITGSFTPKEFLELGSEKRSTMGLRPMNLNELSEIGEDSLERQISRKDEPPLRLEHVSVIRKLKSGKKIKVLNIPHLELAQHEIIAVIGHNGAGKSTFARTVCGLQENAKGKIYLGDKKLSPRQRVSMSYLVMQDVNHQLFTESVREEIMLGMPEEDSEKVTELIRHLELSDYEDRHPMSLSGGQKQRTAIAAAIASDKKIIVFDEPTSGLDYRQMIQFSDLMKNIRKKAGFIIVITHDIEFILSCCTSALKIEGGEIAGFYSKSDKTLTAENITGLM